LEDFAALGQGRYPRRIIRRWSPGTLEIKIDSVEAVTTFADGLFTPAPTAVHLDSCVDPVRAGEPPALYDSQGWINEYGNNSPVDIYPEYQRSRHREQQRHDYNLCDHWRDRRHRNLEICPGSDGSLADLSYNRSRETSNQLRRRIHAADGYRHIQYRAKNSGRYKSSPMAIE
jgi:hypothetical protein